MKERFNEESVGDDSDKKGTVSKFHSPLPVKQVINNGFRRLHAYWTAGNRCPHTPKGGLRLWPSHQHRHPQRQYY